MRMRRRRRRRRRRNQCAMPADATLMPAAAGRITRRRRLLGLRPSIKHSCIGSNACHNPVSDGVCFGQMPTLSEMISG